MIPGGLLGPVGGLEQVWFTSKEDVSRESRFEVVQSLSGRSHAQVRPRQPRSWSCEIPHDAPHEGQILDQLEWRVAHDRTPLVWMPADALGTNMLDPDASLMDPAWWSDTMPGGSRVLPGDGLNGPRFLSSATTDPDGTWAHLSNVPVPHNTTVTASVHLTPYEGDTAHFWLDELTLDGRTVRVHKATATDVLQQVSFTFKTSPETVAVTFGVARANTVVAPQLTLTGSTVPWGVGRGCMSALLDVSSRSPLWTASRQHIYGAADATSFAITELIA